MSDKYVVIGNPIHHSRSPDIHAAFARQTGQDISYARLLAPLDGFARTLLEFRDAGGRGANVTVPFKEEAWRIAGSASRRAELAGAANTLRFDGQSIHADNTDGGGLVNDIRDNLGFTLRGKRILLMGSGGAARGVVPAIMTEQPAWLVIANRTSERASALAQRFFPLGIVDACGYSALQGLEFDCVINATSASLNGELPPLPAQLFAPDSLAYDMMYGPQPTPFMQFAGEQGAARIEDGLGMLVEQAALAFELWRGLRPETASVLAELRKVIQNPSS